MKTLQLFQTFSRFLGEGKILTLPEIKFRDKSVINSFVSGFIYKVDNKRNSRLIDNESSEFDLFRLMYTFLTGDNERLLRGRCFNI